MKRVVISVLVVLLLILAIFYGRNLYLKDQANRETLLPRFSHSDVPLAHIGEPYNFEITGSLIGAKTALIITPLQLPDGLKLMDCKQKYNVSYLPSPNTFISCQLSGTPITAGLFEVSLWITANNYNNTNIQKISINIVQ